MTWRPCTTLRGMTAAAITAAALNLSAPSPARAEENLVLEPAFEWSVPPRFRVPALPPQVSSSTPTLYFDGPVTPAAWRVDLDACASIGPVATFAWKVNGMPVLTTSACDGVSFDAAAEGRYTVTLTVTDADGGEASLMREIRVEDWLVVGVGDSYGSGEGSPDEPVSTAQIDALGTAQKALAAAEAAAADSLAVWLLARDDLEELIPLVNDALAKLSAWEAAVAARDEACLPFPTLACPAAQLAATQAATRLVTALTALGLEALFGEPNLPGAISNLRTSAEQALSLARAALDAAEAAVADAREALEQALLGLGPRWQDRRCHRSALSGQVQAARILEELDPHTSVTFIHLACSGATVPKGLLGEYAGQEPPATAPALPPQIEAAVQLAGERAIDALVVSIGGNDVEFANVIEACVLQLKCFENPPTADPAAMAYISETCSPLGPLSSLCTDYFGGLDAPATSAESIFLGGGTACGGAEGDDDGDTGLDDLPCNYAAIQQELEDLRAQGNLRGLFDGDGRLRLYLTAYPSITRREAATPGGPTELCGFDPTAPAAGRARNLPGVTLPEILWADTFVAPRLADAMEAAAERHGWRYVDDHAAAFDGHGYCADDNWIVRIPESVRTQARAEPLESSIVGSVHPNAAGHEEYARAIADALLCDFYPECSPEPSTTTTTSTSTTTTMEPTSTTGMITTTTIQAPQCLLLEDCDDANPCTDDQCAAGRCQHADGTGPCDDGSLCTAGDTCIEGTCVPGAPLDAALLAGLLADAAETPSACSRGKDGRRARKITKQMKSARKKLAKAAATASDKKRERLIKRAAARLGRASTLAGKLENRLSPECYDTLAELVTTGRDQASCLRLSN